MGTFHHLRHSTADASRSLIGTDAADSNHSFAITIFIWTASAWVLIILFFVLCICQCYSSRNGSEGEDDSTHAGDDDEEDEATSPETASTTSTKIDFVEKLKPTTLTVTPKHLFLRRNSSYRPLNKKKNKNKLMSTVFRCSGNGAPPQGLDCICENTETTSTCREEDDDRGTYHEVDLELQQQQQDPVVQNAQEDDEEEEPMPFDEAAAAESSEIIMVEKEKVTMLRIPVVTSQTRNNKKNKNKNSSSQEEEEEEVTHLFVPNTCAICLGSFRPKQQVSWSSSADKGGGGCSHAFHTSCIVEYAHAVMMDFTSESTTSSSSSSAAEQQPNNKNTPAVLDCPMCRGPFLTIERQC